MSKFSKNVKKMGADLAAQAMADLSPAAQEKARQKSAEASNNIELSASVVALVSDRVVDQTSQTLTRIKDPELKANYKVALKAGQTANLYRQAVTILIQSRQPVTSDNIKKLVDAWKA